MWLINTMILFRDVGHERGYPYNPLPTVSGGKKWRTFILYIYIFFFAEEKSSGVTPPPPPPPPPSATFRLGRQPYRKEWKGINIKKQYWAFPWNRHVITFRNGDRSFQYIPCMDVSISSFVSQKNKSVKVLLKSWATNVALSFCLFFIYGGVNSYKSQNDNQIFALKPVWWNELLWSMVITRPSNFSSLLFLSSLLHDCVCAMGNKFCRWERFIKHEKTSKSLTISNDGLKVIFAKYEDNSPPD